MSDTTDVTSDVSNDRSSVEVDGTDQGGTTRRRRTGSGLSAMLLSELQGLAGQLGISGVARLRKGELVAAIAERQAADGRGAGVRGEVAARVDAPRAEVRAEVRDSEWRAEPVRTEPANSEPRADQSRADQSRADQSRADQPRDVSDERAPRRASRPAGPPEPRGAVDDRGVASGRPERVERNERPAADRNERAGGDRNGRVETNDRSDRTERPDRNGRGESAGRGDTNDRGGRASVERAGSERAGSERAGSERAGSERAGSERAGSDRGGSERAGSDRGGSERSGNGERSGNVDRGTNVDRGVNVDRAGNTDRGPNVDRGNGDVDDDDPNGRRGRRSRFRERRRGRGERPDGDRSGAERSGNDRPGSERGSGGGNESQVNDDDILVPVAGILDVLDNYAFVRTTGYLAGSNDVYVSMAQVKRHGLRRGDAVTGAVRQPRDGEPRRDKYNPLVRLDTINGMDPEEAKRRPEFYKLTPLYPQERLRLETDAHILTTRVIDLVMPMGKGQRALIVSPPKAGKTMVLQAVANAITRNNPECHLMVVLVDERPEEVTDMQRSVKGEVIASTFDRPPQDHTTVSELAIERAKRLVELGHDVVVLLDSITRLGRAYNNGSPASGRILSGGIDSAALYPPKRFLGAARNIENGGSLTIIATALVETGSTGDTVIFEEFKGTGNAELKLDRKIADRRLFPAIDIDPSGTRKEEILLAPDELMIVHKLRKVLHALDSQEALNLLLDRLKKTRTNLEFLMQIAQTTPGE